MRTLVGDLMSSPAVTCEVGTSLADAARIMRDAVTGSVIVTVEGKVAGILTERDLLRAAAAPVSPATETVESWMTAGPDVLGPEEEAEAAWTSLARHGYRHFPVVEGHDLVGVVSLRDLLGVARCARWPSRPPTSPPDWRGWWRPRPPWATCGGGRASSTTGSTRPSTWRRGAPSRTSGTSWCTASFPIGARRPVRGGGGGPGALPPGLASVLPPLAERAMAARGPAHGGVAARRRARMAADARHRHGGAARPGGPPVRRGAHHPGHGLDAAWRRAPAEPRTDLGAAANYLWMVTGAEPPPTGPAPWSSTRS